MAFSQKKTLIFITASFLLAPFIFIYSVNIPFVKKEILSFIKQKTNIEISFSKTSLHISPRLGLSIEDVKIKPDRETSIDISSLKIWPDMKNILLGKPIIEEITVENPYFKYPALIERQKPESLRQQPEPDISWIQKKFSLKNKGDFKLLIKNAGSDLFQKGFLEFSREKAHMSISLSAKKIRMGHEIFSNSAIGKNLNFTSVESDSLELFLKSDGDVSKGALRISKPEINILNKSGRPSFKGDLIEADFSLSDKFKKAVLKPIRMNYPKGTVSIDFTDDKINKKSEISFKGENIDIEGAKKFSLAFFKKNEICRQLFHILLGGNASDIKVSFESDNIKNLFDQDSMLIEGNIQNGWLKIPSTELTVKEIFGKAEVKKGMLNIDTRNGIIKNSRIEKGFIKANLFDSDYSFNGKFDLDMDLSNLPQTLTNLLPGTLLSKELSLVDNISGNARAEIGLSLAPPASGLNVEIEADSILARGKYKRIPGNFVLDLRNFKYSKNLITVQRFKSRIDSHPDDIIIENITIDPFPSRKQAFDYDKDNLLKGNLKADILKYKSLRFSDLKSRFSLKDNTVNLKLNNSDLCGLKIKGDINLENNTITADFPIKAQEKKNIGDLLECLFDKTGLMDGKYSLVCDISGHGPIMGIKDNIKGKIRLRAEKGRIYRLTLLSRLLSFLNISNVIKIREVGNFSQKGFAYKKIIIEADIRNNRIYLTEMIIDGFDMTLAFSGWVDPINDKIEITCLVTPPKKINRLFKNIPILKSLINRKLISIPAKATGKLSDPAITPLHPSAVTDNLKNTLSYFLQSPVKLLNRL